MLVGCKFAAYLQGLRPCAHPRVCIFIYIYTGCGHVVEILVAVGCHFAAYLYGLRPCAHPRVRILMRIYEGCGHVVEKPGACRLQF